MNHPQGPDAVPPDVRSPGPTTAGGDASALLRSSWPRDIGKAFAVSVVLLFLLAVLRRGWMCDDAFITMRSVDNLVNGRGFVFNVGERVQSFSNPLWALLIALPYKLTKEPMVTTIIACTLTSLTFALMLVFGVARERTVGALVLLALCFSRAFVDFSTSGLENALSHLLLLCLAWTFLSQRRTVFKVTLLAALCWVNRFDSLPLVVPLVLATFIQHRSWRAVGQALLGLLPALAWLGFALVYYGFPFPNTAYAKLNADIPRLERMAQGVAYLFEVLYNDSLSAALLVLALVCGWAAYREKGRVRVLLLSIVCGVAYVISVGGDFMAGRFLTPVLALSSVVLVRVGDLWLSKPTELRWAAAALGVTLMCMPFSPFRDEPSRERQEIPPTGIANERAWYMFSDQLGLGSNLRRKLWQGNHGYQSGYTARKNKERVTVAGNIGMYGLGAGPDVHIVDPLALTDPLLARLPYVYDSNWRSGHLLRPIPDGYLDSIKRRTNVVKDPCIRAYYDQLRTVTSEPLFSRKRLSAIVRLNAPGGATIRPCPGAKR